MAVDGKQIGEAVAFPTKSFFVSMLTRDIELQDAILDLLDNCVDGILRTGKPDAANPKPYDGFSAEIIMAKDHFIIRDNCGGIPIDTAKKYAFAMGRPEGADALATSATVGMYGIGMKRAMFKLGTLALVESWNDTGFVVEVTPEWMAAEGWAPLPMFELPDGKVLRGNTTITVYTLHEDVAAHFSKPAWIEEFRKSVSQHYSIILEKGFTVSVGDGVTPPIQVTGEPFRLLETPAQGDKAIRPYIYIGKLSGVDVEIYVGLYRQLPTSEELDQEEETRGESDDAGWTVACNDRVVIWKDKTRLTGWGEATVPNYHGQFIAITGIVLLKCDDPRKLPLTTTKRGIDAGSIVYSEVKDLMRESTKQLTSFTNQWKKFPAKLETIYQQSEYVDLPKLRTMPSTLALSTLRKHPEMQQFRPTYPVPVEQRTHLVVRFEAPRIDVDLLAKSFFGPDQTSKPGEVGLEAFNRAVKAERAE